MSTPNQLAAAFRMVAAVGEAIQTLSSVPSGHLYAQVMSKISFEDYDRVIRTLVDARLVRRADNHLLTWIGPRRETL